MVDAGDRIRKRVQQALSAEKQSNVYSPYSGQVFTPNFTPGENSVVKQSPYACTNACADTQYPGSLFFSAQTAPAFVQVTNASSLAIGTSNFTIEWWQYLNPPVPASTTVQPYVFGFAPNLTQNPSIAAFWNLTGPTYTAYSLTVRIGSTNYTFNSVAAVSSLLNRWVHVAIVGTGTAITVYFNGVQSSSSSVSYNISNSTSTYPFFIIGNSSPWAGQFQFPGFMTDFRFTIGTAVYTAAFTPPKQPLVPLATTDLLLNAYANAPLADSSPLKQTVSSGISTVGWDNVSPYYPVN